MLIQYHFALYFYLIFSMGFVFLTQDKVWADSWKNLQSGDQAAQEFLNKLDVKKAEAGPHPFYEGVSKEANLKDADLEATAKDLARQDPVGQMIHESHDSRPKMNIDPQKDPLLVRSQKVMDNPLKDIGGNDTRLTEITQGGKDETLICEEPGEDYFESCQQNLKVTVIKTKVKKEWKGTLHYWMGQAAIKNGHYLACAALRQGVFTARQYAGDITSAYKACVQELGSKLSGGCVQLPSLNFKTNQIIDVHVEKAPSVQRRHRLATLRFYTNCSGLTYNSLDNKKSHYDCQPLIKIIYEEDSYQVLPDEWVLSCDQLEERADQGLCSYV